MPNNNKSEWDKLWGFDYNVDHGLVLPAKWVREVKTEGDKLQAENKKVNDRNSHLLNNLMGLERDIRALKGEDPTCTIISYSSIDSFKQEHEKLEEIREFLRNAPLPPEEALDHIMELLS